jgi:hypothetical protein
MKHTKCVLLLFLCLLNTNVLISQNSVNAGGGDATGSGGSVAFSAGQVVYTSVSNSLIYVDQGVQQAYEVSQVSVDESFIHQIEIYPNPADDVIQILTGEADDLKFELVDAFGKVISSGPLGQQMNSLNLKEFAPASYVLRIQDGMGKNTVFKIIKN